VATTVEHSNIPQWTHLGQEDHHHQYHSDPIHDQEHRQAGWSSTIPSQQYHTMCTTCIVWLKRLYPQGFLKVFPKAENFKRKILHAPWIYVSVKNFQPMTKKISEDLQGKTVDLHCILCTCVFHISGSLASSTGTVKVDKVTWWSTSTKMVCGYIIFERNHLPRTTNPLTLSKMENEYWPTCSDAL